MPPIQFGAGIVDARGSAGGMTFTRSAAGAAVRTRVKPVNPRSAGQSSARARLSQLSRHWGSELTDQERIDWIVYAENTSWTNKLGQAITINGMAAFVRLNAVLMEIGEPIREGAPTAFGHAGQVVFTFTAEPTSGDIDIAEPSAPFDKDLDDSIVVYTQFAPTGPGRMALPKRSGYLGFVEGDLAVPPTFPTTISTLYTLQAGQRVNLRAVYIDPDFRMSGNSLAVAIAADP